MPTKRERNKQKDRKRRNSNYSQKILVIKF